MADLARTILLLRIAALPADVSPFTRAATPVGRSLLRRVWVRSYRRVRAIDPRVVRRWETVCATARLWEGIDDEVEPMLRLLDERQRRA